MEREKLEHLMTIGMIEGQHSRGNTGRKDVDGLIKWLNVGQMTESLKATKF